jgi:hypothetical protein
VATLQSAVNDVVGRVTDENQGLRYYSNYSLTATPGASAPNALTIPVKAEANPLTFLDDPDAHFPGLYFQIRGMFPSTIVRGKHYECTFRVRCYFIDKLVTGQYQEEQARIHAVALTENVMGADRLGLDWIDSIVWDGCDYDNDIADMINFYLPDYFCGATHFTINASGLVF